MLGSWPGMDGDGDALIHRHQERVLSGLVGWASSPSCPEEEGL